jgi:hypothetical protein
MVVTVQGAGRDQHAQGARGLYSAASSLVIEGNQVNAWYVGIQVTFQPGTSTNPAYVGRPRISNNTILTRRSGILLNSGYSQLHHIYDLVISDNTVMQHDGGYTWTELPIYWAPSQQDNVWQFYAGHGIYFNNNASSNGVTTDNRYIGLVVMNNKLTLRNRQADTGYGILGPNKPQNAWAVTQAVYKDNTFHGFWKPFHFYAQADDSSYVGFVSTYVEGNTHIATGSGAFMTNEDKFLARSSNTIGPNHSM